MKLHNILLELYQTVYSAIGVDFMEIDKVQDFYTKYFICMETEDKIVNDFLNSKKLSSLEKRVIKSSYYMGVSPSKLKKDENKVVKKD